MKEVWFSVNFRDAGVAKLVFAETMDGKDKLCHSRTGITKESEISSWYDEALQFVERTEQLVQEMLRTG